MWDYGRYAVGHKQPQPRQGNNFYNNQDDDDYDEIYEERPVDTIVLVGVMGSGKSSLGNILALRDDQAHIPAKREEQIFQTSASESATTLKAKVVLTASTLITAGK